MKPGDTFIPSVPGISRHLWVVIYEKDGLLAAVNFTTNWPESEQTSVVLPGEHPFVKHETVVAYSRAVLLGPEAAAALEKPGMCQQMDPVSPSLLRRIQAGARNSKFTPQKIQKLLQGST